MTGEGGGERMTVQGGGGKGARRIGGRGKAVRWWRVGKVLKSRGLRRNQRKKIDIRLSDLGMMDFAKF